MFVTSFTLWSIGGRGIRLVVADFLQSCLQKAALRFQFGQCYRLFIGAFRLVQAAQLAIQRGSGSVGKMVVVQSILRKQVVNQP